MTAIDNIITPRIELAVRSTTASTEQDTTIVTANLDRVERAGITASFENVSERNNTNHELNANDETRQNIPYKVSEFLATITRFDQQSHTHYSRGIVATAQP